MANTVELIKKQLNEIPNLRNLPSSEDPKFAKWKQLTLAILKRHLGEEKYNDFPSHYNFWPNRIGPWTSQELSETLNEGLTKAEAFLEGLVEEIEILGIQEVNDDQKDQKKNLQFGSFEVSGSTIVFGDGNSITQVEVKDLVKALELEIKQKVPESDEKKSVLKALKEITTNETFATVTGAVLGELLKRLTTI